VRVALGFADGSRLPVADDSALGRDLHRLAGRLTEGVS